jgi:uncharacterized protein (TIGR02147 family)
MLRSAVTIFDFSDYKEFLKYRINQKLLNKFGKKTTNISGIANDLGYSTPSLLSMVVNGKRAPSKKFCDTLANSWKFTLKESEYFRLLIELDRCKLKGEDAKETIDRIKRLTRNKTIHSFTDQDFSIIREWHYLVIRQLVSSKSFREDPHWISKSLNKKITPSQAQYALTRLEEMKIISRSVETGKLYVANHSTQTTHEIPSASIRLHHSEMLKRASEALEERLVVERFFNSLTINFDLKRLPEIKKRLGEFVRCIDEEFSSNDANSIYQLNLQFFEHTINMSNQSQFSNVEVSNAIH